MNTYVYVQILHPVRSDTSSATPSQLIGSGSPGGNPTMFKQCIADWVEKNSTNTTRNVFLFIRSMEHPLQTGSKASLMCMHALVFVEFVPAGEPLPASTALVRLLPSVHPHVFYQD